MTQMDEDLNELRAKLGERKEDQAAEAAEASPSLAEMNALAAEIADLRDAEKAAADVKKEITAKLEAKENRVIELLVESGNNSYKSPAGLLSLSFRLSAKLPVGPAKEAFFAYLREQGRFEDMISVSSATYCSFVKEQYELARERGENEPVIPGVSDVKTSPNLSFRRTR